MPSIIFFFWRIQKSNKCKNLQSVAFFMKLLISPQPQPLPLKNLRFLRGCPSAKRSPVEVWAAALPPKYDLGGAKRKSSICVYRGKGWGWRYFADLRSAWVLEKGAFCLATNGSFCLGSKDI